jgi:hypothetical protein
MDISTIYKFNKLIKSHNDEISDTKKKSISKNITKQVLNLKKNNKDRTKILNSYRKWLKNNNDMKSVQMGGANNIYQNIVTKLEALGKNCITFTQKITNLQEMFNDPSKSTNYQELITNLKNSSYDNKVSDIMQLFELFNEKNLLGNIIQNYYSIFNNDSLKNLIKNSYYTNTQKGQYVNKDDNFNDVIFSKIATGTFYEQKPNKASKGFYNAWNVNAKPPTKPSVIKPATAKGTVNATVKGAVNTTSKGTVNAPVNTTSKGTVNAPVNTTSKGTVNAPVNTTSKGTVNTPVNKTVKGTVNIPVNKTAKSTVNIPAKGTTSTAVATGAPAGVKNLGNIEMTSLKPVAPTANGTKGTALATSEDIVTGKPKLPFKDINLSSVKLKPIPGNSAKLPEKSPSNEEKKILERRNKITGKENNNNNKEFKDTNL